ncbi:MAG TPA: IPT/TIG domain-containing protein [Acidimicrobiia bacterium]
MSTDHDVPFHRSIRVTVSAEPTATHADSADGRYVAFGSTATSLDGSDTNGARDMFVRASVTPVVTSVSPSSAPDGEEVFVTLIGHGFLDHPPPSVNFGDANIIVGSMNVIDDSHVGGYLDIFTKANQGPHNALFLNAGTGPSKYAVGGATCAGCFSVDPPPP